MDVIKVRLPTLDAMEWKSCNSTILWIMYLVIKLLIEVGGFYFREQYKYKVRAFQIFFFFLNNNTLIHPHLNS